MTKPKSKTKPMKAADIRAALRKRYAQPECAIVFEVAQGTGLHARRHLDAVAMELWPSRGLSLHGIEIKVSMADFKKERADPTKAEEIARFCDYFWIAAPKGLISIGELPAAWGLIEISPGGRVSYPKAATKTEAHDGGRLFLAALLRAASRSIDTDEVDAMMAARTLQLQEQFQERVDREARRLTEGRNNHAERWRALAEHLGVDPDSWSMPGDIGPAVKLVMTSGIARSWHGIRDLHKTVGEFHGRLAAAVDEMGIEPPEDPAKRRQNGKTSGRLL